MPKHTWHDIQIFCSLASLLILSILASGVFSGSAAQTTRIKGVPPELAARYVSDTEHFKCFSGEPTISFDRVNDNFCDCVDGSDEPGTSACPLGRFYCRNKAHTPKLLNSSSVDDGYCDCCDGSDESSGKCPNTCAEAGAANRAALKARSTALKLGLKAREKYVSKAVTGRSEWQQVLARVAREAEGLQRTVSRLQTKKERIDKEEAKEREAEEKLRKQREEEEAAKKAAEQPAAGDQTVDSAQEAAAATEATDPQSALPSEGTGQEGATKPTQSVNDLVEGEKEEEEELSVEEQGRRIASQWTNDPEASGHAETPSRLDLLEQQQAVETESPEPKMEASEGVADLDYEAEEDVATAPLGSVARLREWASSKLGWGSGASTAKSGRQAIKDAYAEKSTRLTELAQRKAALEGKLKNDYGPSDAFLTLADRCFEVKVEKYVYEMCPFGSAAQKDGGMSTSLGTWHGFEDSYNTMVFKNGQGCWSGPNRSIRVTVECGAKEEVWDVVEPNRCEYHARFATPAACSREEATSVQEQIAAVEHELASKDEL